MAEVGDSRGHRRALYDLSKTCSADIPERGKFDTFEEYLDQRIETETYDPRGFALALHDGTWVGLASTSTTSRPSP